MKWVLVKHVAALIWSCTSVSLGLNSQNDHLLWNSLPLHVRLSPTLDIFKILLDDYFRDIWFSFLPFFFFSYLWVEMDLGHDINPVCNMAQRTMWHTTLWEVLHVSKLTCITLLVYPSYCYHRLSLLSVRIRTYFIMFLIFLYSFHRY